MFRKNPKDFRIVWGTLRRLRKIKTEHTEKTHIILLLKFILTQTKLYFIVIVVYKSYNF